VAEVFRLASSICEKAGLVPAFLFRTSVVCNWF